MSSTSDPLNALDTVTSGADTLNKIVAGAEKSLLIIAPWHGAESENPQMQQLIQNIVGYCTIYIQAIDTSIKTAEDGYSISSDAVDLCDFLLDPEVDSTQLRDFIKDMQSKAKEAHQDCTITMNKFNEVQTGLLEMTKAIPKEALAAQGGGNSLAIRFFGAISNTTSKAISFGRKKPISIEAAMKELHLAALDISQLSKTVGEFVGWWAQMETNLVTVEGNSSRLIPNKGNQLRIKTIQKKWTEVKNDYGNYKVEIVKLRGHYPPGIKTT